jgi:hypothetical protein
MSNFWEIERRNRERKELEDRINYSRVNEGSGKPTIFSVGGGAETKLQNVDFVEGDKNEIHFHVNVNITSSGGSDTNEIAAEVSRQMAPIFDQLRSIFSTTGTKFGDAVRKVIATR